MQQKNLQFVEGTSSKFWNATQDDTTLTITYGRIGTAGQTQVKTFASETEAASAFVKQVAEKEKKGYSAGPLTPTDPLTPAQRGDNEEKPPPSIPPAGRGMGGGGERQIKLTDSDRRRARVLPLPEPKPRPEPKPFTVSEGLERLAKIGKPDEWNYYWKWEKAGISPSMTKEEAAFWWQVVLIAFGQNLQFEAFLKQVKALAEKPIPVPDVQQLASFQRTELTFPAFTLFGVEGIVRSFAGTNDWQRSALVIDFEKTLLPHLTAEERAALKAQLEERLTTTTQELWVLRLLVQLGCEPKVIATEVAKWPDGAAKPPYFGGYYGNRGNEYLAVLVGLRDPEAIAREARRLDALLASADDVRLLLAATEFRCLDLITKSALLFTAKAEAESMVKAFALAEAPEVAPYLLEVMLESKAPQLARQWLDEHPEHATEGLLTIACGQGKKADAALAYLRGLKKRELGYVIETKLEGQPESVVSTIRERVLDTDDVVYEPLTDDETPEWVKAVFGGELTVADLPADENPERRLLVDGEWTAPTLPPLPDPLPFPSAPAFDFDACWARLAPLHYTSTHGNFSYWQLYNIELTLPMSREEAHFWLEAWAVAALSRGHQAITPAELEMQLRGVTFGQGIEKERLAKPYGYSHSLVVPFWVLFGRDGLLEILHLHNVAATFVKQVLPYLDAAERAALLEHVPERFPVLAELRAYQGINEGLVLLEHLHVSVDELERILRTLVPTTMSVLMRYVLRLPTPQTRVEIAQRLSVYPRNEAEARQWLGATGWLGVERLGAQLEGGYYDKVEAIKMLQLVEAPEVARYFVALRKFPSTKLAARAWLDRFPAFAIEGLAPLLVEKEKKAIELATEYLRELKRKGLGWLIAKKLPTFEEKVQWELKTRVLDYDPRKEKAAAPRDQALAPLLPPVLVKTEKGPRRLTVPQAAMLVAELRTTPIIEPSPSLQQVKQSADKRSLDAFAWALFEGWLHDGGPSKDRWKMEALGHLGGDAVALKLTPLIRQWPGESHHQRAVLGLECLRAIGTDTALMQINGIAEKISFKGVKERAKEAMEAIATERNFTRDELADRIIPDGGLDARGSRVFDFGTRQFTFLLSAELKPMVRGADGKRLPDLPKPNTKDDPDKAAEALAAWKLLKKQVGEIAKTQAIRLEQAMVVGRRWTPDEFQQLFVSHPVMVHLVRRVIWAAYDESGKPLACFRVADDSTLADESDELWVLPETVATVGIVHPSHLTAAQQGTWGELLADYEIIPPFLQLGRPTYTLTDDEKAAKTVTRFKGVKNIDPKVLLFGLDTLGWTRGAPQDGGWFSEHYKIFPAAGVTAVVSYTGAPVGYMDGWEDQEVEEFFFLSDESEATRGWLSSSWVKSLVPTAEVDPVIVSEVLHDLTRLVEKGKKA